MGLFDKFSPLAEIRDQLEQLGEIPFGVVTEKILSATEGIVRGQQMILAGTNNYLGLTFDPECIAAAVAAVQQEGTGTTGSRMANGTFAGHAALERELAAFFRRRAAIVFSTGFSATMGMPATLVGPDDVIIFDADCHASIYDGIRLSGATAIRFRHNDAADLEKRLRRIDGDHSNVLIIVEGIYSMLGDQAPLAEIVDVKRRCGGYLLVDEAHSMGVLGHAGRGLAEAQGVEDDVDFVVGTFSKSLGAIGGYCVSNHAELEAVRYAIRSYIFTASSSPSVIASTRAALRIAERRPELRDQLWRNAETLYRGLGELGFQLGPMISPVVAVIVDDRERAVGWWNALLDRGIYVNLVVPPASPASYSLLRCSLSAAHTDEQVAKIIDGFAALVSPTSSVRMQ